MKLLRYGPPGAETPGLLDQRGRLRSLAGHVRDLDGAALAPAGLAALAAIDPAGLPLVEGDPRLGPPLAGIGNIIAIGLNYRDHARETNMALPTEPIVFSKHTGALAGPDDAIQIPPGAERVDWEVELALAIGTPARRVSVAAALGHVAGYMTVNDVSERDWQAKRGGQWIKGKSWDSFCPLGPWLVTADEVPDPQALRLWLDVDGERMQESSTAEMVFPVAQLISYVSHFMPLLPGDVILTGTPAGVGLGRQRFLRPGEVVRLGVDGLGEQTHKVVAGS